MDSNIKNNDSKFENVLHEIFEFGIFLKFFNGIWETASGFLILILSKETINNFFSYIAGTELLENPRDFIINISSQFLQNLSHSTKIFITAYILIHGITNLFLAIQLYRDRIWAYLVTVFIMTILALYQIHRIILYHSPVLIVITVFDILFIILTWHEYDRKKLQKVV